MAPRLIFSARESIEGLTCSFRIQHHEHPLADPSLAAVSNAKLLILDLTSQFPPRPPDSYSPTPSRSLLPGPFHMDASAAP